MPRYDDPIDWDSSLVTFDKGDVTTDPNRTPPKIIGLMRESSNYQVMGAGLSDRIFILGYGNITMNDPHHVISMRETIQKFSANVTIPVFKGLFEAYYAGARDIFLVATGPMIEYVTDPTQRLLQSFAIGKATSDLQLLDSGYTVPDGVELFRWDAMNFYERHNVRLQAAYKLLEDWDLPQIIVPIDAPFYDAGGVDFLAPLADHCANSYATTGAIRFGLIGTQTNLSMTETALSNMSLDLRLATFDNDDGRGKFVSIIAGEGVFQFGEMPTAYAGPLNVAAAGMMSRLAWDESIIYKPFPNVVNLIGKDFDQRWVDDLSNAGVNLVIRTTKGRRGQDFNNVISNDNTLSATGSDFWALQQMRLVQKIIEQLRVMSYRHLGGIGLGQFRTEVNDLFVNLVRADKLRSFSANIYIKNPLELASSHTIVVDVSIQPFFALKTIYFTAEVGPGA